MNKKLMACLGLLLLCLVCIAAWFIFKAPTDEISQNITIKDVEKLSDEELLGTYVKGWELSMVDRNKLAFSQAADIPSMCF